MHTVDPFNGPLGLFLNRRDRFNRIQQSARIMNGNAVAVGKLCLPEFFLLITDVCIDEEGVHFAVNIFHHDLETIKTSSFRHLNFRHEPFRQILQHNSVTIQNSNNVRHALEKDMPGVVPGGEKGEDIFDKMLFVFTERVPIRHIHSQIHLFRRPKTCLHHQIIRSCTPRDALPLLSCTCSRLWDI